MRLGFRILSLVLLCIFLLGGGIPINLSTFQIQQSNGGEGHPYGGHLRVGLDLAIDPTTLNPLVEPGIQDIMLLFAWDSIYLPLVEFDENGSFSACLAKSWNISDPKNIEFYLDEIYWHDSHMLDAGDISFTMNAILNESSGVNDFWRDAIWGDTNLLSVEEKNASTVIFHFQNTFAPSLTCIALTPIALAEHIHNRYNLTESPYGIYDHPVGQGPFMYDDWDPNVGLEVIANSNYFKNELPYINRISFLWNITSNELANALEGNEIDIVPYSMDPSRMDDLANTIGTSVINREMTAFGAIGINHSHPILTNVKVRQALSYAIDRQTICNIAFLGYRTPATGPITPNQNYWYTDEVKIYDFNLTLAEEMLNDSGFPLNETTGIRFELALKIPPGALSHTAMATTIQIVKDNFQSVGVNLTIEETWEFIVNFDLYMLGWNVGSDPDQYSLWHTNGAQNFGGYSNGTVDDLIVQGRQTMDLGERKLIMLEFQKAVAWDLPNLYLNYKSCLTAYNNDFHNFISSGQVWSVSRRSLEQIYYEPTMSGEGNCPYRVCFTDSQNKKTGYYDGSGYEEIPNSTYSGVDSDPQLVKLRNPSSNYLVELFGVENDSFEFEFVNIALDYKNVWIASGYIYEGTTRSYNVTVYGDGSMRTFAIGFQWDVTGDSYVGIDDIVMVAEHFGSSPDLDWYPTCDINFDDYVGIDDIVETAEHFGESI